MIFAIKQRMRTLQFFCHYAPRAPTEDSERTGGYNKSVIQVRPRVREGRLGSV